MPTVEELEIVYRDQISAGAAAGAANLNKLADAAETVDTKITRTTKSATAWVNSQDNVTKSANRLEKAQRDLAASQETLSKGVENGTVTQDQAARAIANQEANIAALTKRHAEFVSASGKSTEATNASGEAAKEASGLLDRMASSFGVQTYQVRYAGDEIHRFVDQVLAGGSPLKAMAYQLPDIAQNLGGLGNIAKVAGGFLAGPAGLAAGAVAVGAAFAVMGVHAENQASELAVLSQHLRATRADYDAVALSAAKAAQNAALQTGVSLPDAKAAVAAFDGVPTIDGTNATQLAALTQEAANLAAMLGTTVPDAAKQMAAAMADPERAAEEFAQKGLFGVTEGLAQQVKALQDSGDKLGAYARLNDQVSASVKGAAHEALTPYQLAIEDLHKAMAGPIQDGKDLAESIGTYVVSAAASSVKALTDLVTTMKDLRSLHVDWSTGNVIDTSKAPAASVASTIESVGASLGANQDVISLAKRIAPVESSAGQFAADGSVVVSSAGARGAMQVMPGSANGNDLNTLTGNVTAAEQILIHLYTKYKGNQILVSMAYNWGEGHVDDYLSGKIAGSSIPQETLNYVQNVTGGHAYSAATTAAKQGSVNDALRTNDGTTAAQMQAEQRAIQQLTSAQQALNDLHDAGSLSDADYADQTSKLTDRLNQHRGVLLDLRDPMQQLAHQQDLATQAAGAYSGAQLAMISADQQAEDAAHKMGDAHASAGAKAAAEERAQAALTNQFNVSIATMDRQTNGQNRLIAGYNGTSGSLDAYIDAEKAAEQVRATSSDDTAEQARQVAILTSHMDSARNSATDLATAQGLLARQQGLETVNKQIALLGANSDDAARAMAALAEHQDLVRRYGSEAAVSASQMAQNEAALADRTEVASLSLQHQQQALSDFSGGVSNVFSTLGDDISQAFTQGAGSAVTFKSVLQGVEAQAASLAVRFALINPILNSLGGSQHLTTLGDIGGVLGSSSGGGVGSLGGIGSLFSSTGLSGLGGSVSTGLSNVWGGLTGSSASSTMSLSVTPGLGVSPIAESAAAGLWNGGGALGGFGTLGGALGIGGSVLPGLLSGNYAQAALGGAGAALGTAILPGVGTVVGGLAGNLLGGLFGGHKKNPYTLDTVSTSGGMLSIGSSYNQAQDDKYTAQLSADLAALNGTFKSLGLTVSAGNGNARGDLGIVGDGAGNAQGSVAAYLNAIRFHGAGGTFGAALDDATNGGFSANDLGSVSAFQAAIASLKTMADTVDTLRVHVVAFNADAGSVTVGGAGSFSGYGSATAAALDHALDGKTLSTSDLSTQIGTIVTFVESTMPQLLQASTAAQSSYQQSIASLNGTYGNAIAQAEALGISTTALSDKLASLKADMLTTANASLGYQTDAILARDMKATGDNLGSDLVNESISARQERTAFDQSWQAIYGDAYTAAAGYGDALALLTKTQADERLAIQKQYADQQTAAAKQAADQIASAQAQQLSAAQQSVSSLLTSLTSFASGLATSNLSPLSAADQYKAANDDYASNLSKAMAGDFGALSLVQGDANALLTASRAYNGSGTAYASDYMRVLQDIQAIGTKSADDVTQSAINAKLDSQTNTLAANQQTLIATTQALLVEMQQANRRKSA